MNDALEPSDIREYLAELDRTLLAMVKLVTCYTDDEIEELGGLSE